MERLFMLCQPKNEQRHIKHKRYNLSLDILFFEISLKIIIIIIVKYQLITFSLFFFFTFQFGSKLLESNLPKILCLVSEDVD